MALSNWDTLAMGIDGPCDGTMTNHEGRSVEIYKNWLYLNRGGRGQGSVHQVRHGDLSWGCWTIDARRGPQNGVFVVAYSSRWLSDRNDLDFAERQVDKRILVGCGVSGYENVLEVYAEQIRAAGYDPEDEDIIFTIGSTWDDGSIDSPERRFLQVVEDGQYKVILDGIEPEGWVGVEQRSVDFLRAMVDEQTTPTKWVDPRTFWPGDALAAIDWDKAVRVNQGDMFFADAFGIDPGATAVGESEEPMIHDAIKGMAGPGDGRTDD